MKYSKIFTALMAAGAIAGTAGCNTTTIKHGNPVDAFFARNIQVGSQKLRVMGKPSDLGLSFAVRSEKDYQILAEAALKLRDLSAKALQKNDMEGFAVARSGQRLLTARLLEAWLPSQAVLNSLFERKDGFATLPPNSSVFLPYADRSTKSRRVSALGMDVLQGVSALNWADSIKVASADDDFARALVNAIKYKVGARAGSMANLPKNIVDDVLGRAMAGGFAPNGSQEEMEEGIVYAGRDEKGQEYLVEKTQQGYVFHNQGAVAAVIPLEEIGYMPVRSVFSPERRQAVGYAKRMQSGILSHFNKHIWGNSAKIAGGFNAGSVAGQGLVGMNLRENAKFELYFDENGDVSQSPADGRRGFLKLQSEEAYSIAWGLFNRNPSDLAFAQACLKAVNQPAYAWELSYEGKEFEKRRLTCYRYTGTGGQRSPLYSRVSYVSETGQFQTYQSILNDKKLAAEIKSIDSEANLLSAVAAFIPLVGTFESGAKCLTNDSAGLAHAYRYFMSSERHDAKAFVESYLPRPDDYDGFSKSLDCAGAIPLAGSAISLARRLTPAAYAAAFDAPKLSAVQDIAMMFDVRLSPAKNAEAYGKIISQTRSPIAGVAAKIAYDATALSNDAASLGKATGDFQL